MIGGFFMIDVASREEARPSPLDARQRQRSGAGRGARGTLFRRFRLRTAAVESARAVRRGDERAGAPPRTARAVDALHDHRAGHALSEAGIIPDDPPLMAAMASYHEDLAKAGVLLDAAGLQPAPGLAHPLECDQAGADR